MSDLKRNERATGIWRIYAMECLSQISSLLDDRRFGTKLPEKPGDEHRRRTQGERIGARRARERTASGLRNSVQLGRRRPLIASEREATTTMTITIQQKTTFPFVVD